MGTLCEGFLVTLGTGFFGNADLCHTPGAMADSSQLQIVGTSINGHLWPNSLAERFSKSLGVHWPELARPRSLETLSRTIAETAQVGIEAALDQSFLTVAARALHIQAATTGVQSLIAKCAHICESPLELSFALALAVSGRQITAGVSFHIGDSAITIDGESPSVLRVQPQAHIGPFRVDFLLSANSDSLVVEIDGWQFHDRNQDQAVRDRKRDRQLAGLGFSTFRFAGSEVWADAFECAGECLSFLCGKQVDQIRKPPSSDRNGGQAAKATTINYSRQATKERSPEL